MIIDFHNKLYYIFDEGRYIIKHNNSRIKEIEGLFKVILSKINDNKTILKMYEKKILSLKSPRLSYFFAKVKGADKKAHSQVVIDSKNPKYNYLFAYYVAGADKKAHGKAVIESKDPKYNYLFARYIYGANVKKHLQVMEESEDKSWIGFMSILDRSTKEIISVLLNQSYSLDDNFSSLNKLLDEESKVYSLKK